MNRKDLYNTEGYKDPTPYAVFSSIEKEQRARKFRPVVFICSPYSGDVEQNLENARRYSRYAVLRGCVPITPHLLLSQFMDDNDPDERNLALRINLILLSKCAELWAFGSCISEGMAQEIARAKRKGKTVRYFTDSCKEVK